MQATPWNLNIPPCVDPQYKKILKRVCAGVMKVVRKVVLEVEKVCFKSQEGLVERQSEANREGTGGNPRGEGNCDERKGDRKRKSDFVVRCII